jgi:hypothetical protein
MAQQERIWKETLSYFKVAMANAQVLLVVSSQAKVAVGTSECLKNSIQLNLSCSPPPLPPA